MGSGWNEDFLCLPVGEQTSPSSPRLSACPALGKTTTGLLCLRRHSLWFIPNLASKKGCLSSGGHRAGVKSVGSPLAGSAPVLTHLIVSTPPQASSLDFPPSSVLPQMELLCCSRRVPTTANFNSSTQSPAKGRNLSHKIDRLRVQMRQGESRQSPLHTGLVFGESSGGGRAGQGYGEDQVPVALALTARN